MVKNINFQEFCDEFKRMDRNNQFSYEGKKALFDYLEQYEEDTNEPIELDIIALCCNYTEFENFKELQGNYNQIKSMEDLENNTTVILIENSEKFIIQNF